ncbi:MAG: hypothetical protein GY733_13955 [bacterium]|nr:hypothetical protein [bacterium]
MPSRRARGLHRQEMAADAEIGRIRIEAGALVAAVGTGTGIVTEGTAVGGAAVTVTAAATVRRSARS